MYNFLVKPSNEVVAEGTMEEDKEGSESLSELLPKLTSDYSR